MFQVSSFRFVAQSLTKFYTELHGGFLKWIVLKRDAQRRCAFFLFQVSSFRFVAQSLTKFYTELHGGFLKWIVLREMHGDAALVGD